MGRVIPARVDNAARDRVPDIGGTGPSDHPQR
ncbi:hypothetical protein QFZ66_000635 [Streptomyces sp. B4I13]|nr:hypothetical protein [Streptomyces sp. B4I13]